MTAPRDAAHYDFSPYERGVSGSTAYDQAVAILQQFLTVMGWPAGINSPAMIGTLLKHGLELEPSVAFNVLFKQISPTLQAAHPYAEFGMTHDAWVSQTNALKDSFEFYTGSQEIPHDILRMAIDQGWTSNEMLSFLQKDGRFTDPAQMPWLTQGMGYRDVKNQFVQVYGKAPVNPIQLASWFNFKTGAAQIQSGPPAAISPSSGPQKNLPSQSEVR